MAFLVICHCSSPIDDSVIGIIVGSMGSRAEVSEADEAIASNSERDSSVRGRFVTSCWTNAAVRSGTTLFNRVLKTRAWVGFQFVAPVTTEWANGSCSEMYLLIW